jgi:DNA primase large subunit
MSTGLSLRIASKYPWSKIASKFVANSDINIKELTNNSPEVLFTKDRLKLAIDLKSTLSNEAQKEITESPYAPYSFPISKIILSIIQDTMLLRRWAVFESKISQLSLENEKSELIEGLSKENFNWNLIHLSKNEISEIREKSGMNYYYKLFFTDFLTVNTSFHDLSWKLTNQIIVNGYVFLNEHSVNRLISERIKIEIQDKGLIKINEEELGKGFLDTVNEIKEYWEKTKKAMGIYSMDIKGPVTKQFFPPCISNQLSKLLSGENISHQGRFTLTSFFLNIGMKDEEILNIFRTSPDFDEKKAAYQIRHIKGRRFGKTKYTPPSCKTLRTYGLCVNRDMTCERSRHPLEYYKLKRFNRSR